MADPPPFDPNKPYTTGGSGPPKFDPSKPYTTNQTTPDPQPDVLGTQRGGRSLDIMPVVRGARDFVEAIPQGVLGIPEALYQYGEHVFGLPRPGPWADPLRRYQQQSESTWPGFFGETAGNIGGFVAGGEVADALGLASKVPAVATRTWNMLSPAARHEISTIFQSQVAQPTQGDDFWTQKGESAFLAHLLGTVFGRASQQAQHDVATTTNKGLTEADRKDVAAIEQANKAAATAHTQTVKTEAEQHKALSEAQEQFHQQQRAQQQSAADALNQQREQDVAQRLSQRKAQIDTRNEVPRQTTQGWWDRTLAQIGVKDPALTRAAPATGAKVRDIVGGRLNQIMQDMHLDPNDPAFTQHINEIRDEVLQNLPKDEKAGWFNKPPEPELNPLLVHPTTGQPLERTTRGVREKAPEEPSGTFYSTVMAPLSKEPMTGRALTNYVSRIGARAEQLAKEAAQTPGPRRTVLQAQADALRNIEDAVIGHAAGTPEQKTALETARRAYFMWAIGNDAARAANNGVATPKQLISSMTRRMRGEARYEQAVNDPANPYHDTVNWLQGQNTAHTTPVPSAAEVRGTQTKAKPTLPAKPTPIPPPTPRAAASAQPLPAPRSQVPVPEAPRRPTRSYTGAAGHGALAGTMYALGHPLGALFETREALRSLLRRTPLPEGRTEEWMRKQMTRHPRAATRPIGATLGTAAAQAPRAVPPKVQRGIEKAGSVLPHMFYKWVMPDQ